MQGNVVLYLHTRSSISSVKEVGILTTLHAIRDEALIPAWCPAYGVVYRARHRPSSRVVALKQVRILADERQNGVPITALREISILRSLKHPNIIHVLDVAVGEQEMDEIYMAMEYVEQVGAPRPTAAA